MLKILGIYGRQLHGVWCVMLNSPTQTQASIQRRRSGHLLEVYGSSQRRGSAPQASNERLSTIERNNDLIIE